MSKQTSLRKLLNGSPSSTSIDSMILARIAFDTEKLRSTIKTIEDIPFTKAYSQYTIGNWESSMLWNRSGKAKDDKSVEYEGHAIPTENAEQLTYINDLITSWFNVPKLKSVRLFRACNGLIIPHRDYLEFDRGFTRIHVPLQTNDESFTSEDAVVFRMRVGEVWFLESNNVHSAGCFSDSPRVHLVLDFEADLELDHVFRDVTLCQPSTDIQTFDRPKLNAFALEAIFSLSKLLHATNFREIVAILAKLHFNYGCNAADMYEWMEVITSKCGNKILIDKAAQMRREFLGPY